MLEELVRKILWIIFGFWLCGLLSTANAETYGMTDGTSITGDIISFNDDGVIFHTADDKYTGRISWTLFSQSGLKALAKNPKIAPYAEPFIETPPPTRSETHIDVHRVDRLALPPKGSVIGGLFTSSVGLVAILLIYIANLYAAFEIAIFRARPIGLVTGVSAAAPIIGPIVFLSMPTHMEGGATEEDMQVPTGAPPEAVAAAPAAEAQAQTTEAVHLASAPALPETQVFQRGQFTFNRRFFETKFSGFFGVMRHGPDKDMVLVIKTPRAQYVAHRITRIAANEAHFEVMEGPAHKEVMVPFGEIQEIQLKHKNA